MKVVVFGATGSVGKLAVAQLLEQGHEVTAFARHPEKLDMQDVRLRLVAGDAMEVKDVWRAVEGQDAAVITIGAGMSRTSQIRSKGTLNVIKAMQGLGVRRLIVQSTLGARESWGNLNFFWKHIMFGALLRPVFLDHELQERLVEASGLDWTIVRPSSFTDGPATGDFKVGFGLDTILNLKISRADVAAFLARQLADPKFMRQAVGISN